MYRPNEFIVLDLETGVMKEVKTARRGGHPYTFQPHDFQLNGSLVAFKENSGVLEDTMSLRVVDADTGTEIYSGQFQPSYDNSAQAYLKQRFFLLKDKVRFSQFHTFNYHVFRLQ